MIYLSNVNYDISHKFSKCMPFIMLLCGFVLWAFSSVHASEIKISDTELYAKHQLEVTSLSGFPEFEGSSIGNSATFYNLKSNKTAYVFKITKNGNDIGFVTMTADDDFYPLFLMSSGVPPQKNVGYFVSKLLHDFGQQVISSKLLYFGTLDFFVELVSQTGERRYFGLRSREEVPRCLIEALDKQYDRKAVELANKQPNAFENAIADMHLQQVQEEMFIPGIDDAISDGDPATTPIDPNGDGAYDDTYAYTWYRGCSITASTMMLSWWGRHETFFSNIGINSYPIRCFQWSPDHLNSSSYCRIPGYPGWYNNDSSALGKKFLADQIADISGVPIFGSGSYGSWGFEQAIPDVASYNGYIFNISKKITNNVFDQVRNEIDRDRPVLLGFGEIDGSNCEMNYNHLTFGIGYASGTLNQLLLFNTWAVDSGDQDCIPQNRDFVTVNNCASQMYTYTISTDYTLKDTANITYGSMYEAKDVSIGDKAIHYYEFTPDSQFEDLTVFIDGSGGWGMGYDPKYLVARYDQSGNLILSFDQDGDVVDSGVCQASCRLN